MQSLGFEKVKGKMDGQDEIKMNGQDLVFLMDMNMGLKIGLKFTQNETKKLI